MAGELMLFRNPIRKVTTRDGTPLTIRPIQPDDAPHFLTIFAHLGSDSRYRRFHQPVDHLSADYLADQAGQMVQESLSNGRGWLAFAEEEVVGGIRYVRMGGDSAEFSVTVRDDWQGKGIATLLMQQMLAGARQDGLRRIIGMIQGENRAVWRLMQATGLPLHRTIDGSETTVEMELLP
jgi:acetyltransferase